MSEEAIAAEAAIRVENASAMLHVASRLLAKDEERKRMGEQALAFARQHRGATTRTVALLKRLIG